jgi:hypothetical protein
MRKEIDRQVAGRSTQSSKLEWIVKAAGTADPWSITMVQIAAAAKMQQEASGQ